MPPISRNRLGVITSGSLVEGLCARLEGRESVEDMGVGKFVVIKGEKHEFFSMITDVVLEATNQKVLVDPPNGDLFIHEVLAGTSTYGSIKLKPMLMLPRDLDQGLLPVKTIPHHFAPVQEADESDFQRVFGSEDATHFEIGRPLDMDVPVCIDLERLVERSNGIFGKSGTGKSFLTRLLLCGTIKSGVASNLIFDMHSEYGWDAQSEEGTFVKGLRQLYGSQVLIYSLDAAASRKRGVPVDEEIVLGLDQIEVEDVMLLQEELNLNATAAESSYLLVDRFKEGWLKALLAMDTEAIKEFAESVGGHAGAISALKRKLEQVARQGFVKEKAASLDDRPDDRPPGARPTCGAGIRPLPRRAGLYAGGEYHHPPHPSPLGRSNRRVPALEECGRQAAPADDHDRRGAQVSQPHHREADDLRHDRPRAAQV